MLEGRSQKTSGIEAGMSVVSAAGRQLGYVSIVDGDDIYVYPDPRVVDAVGYRVSAPRRRWDFRLKTDHIDSVTEEHVRLVEL